MQAVANRTLVPVRQEPDQSAQLTDEVIYGMPVEILESALGWCHIRTHYCYEGYCKRADLLTGDQATQFLSGDLKVMMQAYGDVLSIPKVQGICLQSIPRGGRIQLIRRVEEKEGWMKVRLVNGKYGYTKEKFLGPLYEQPCTESEDCFRHLVVETARSYMGVQYRWGGKTPLGIDCSGLTSMSYLLCGVVIYRDALIVPGFAVREISYEQMKPGDMIYFPGHVAMYLGDEKYIHATGRNQSDGVVVNSLRRGDPDYRSDLPEMMTCVGSIF